LGDDISAFFKGHDYGFVCFANKFKFQRFSQALPIHVHNALQKWYLVTQGKMASPLDFNPSYLEVKTYD